MTGLRLLIAVFLTLVVQLSLVRRVAIFGVQPDLVILLLVLLAGRRGPASGALLGFGIGLLQDLLVPETLGMNALAKSVVGWAMGKLSRQLAMDSVVLYLSLVVIAVLAHDLIYLICLTRLDVGRLVMVYLTNSLPSALYTGVSAAVIGGIAILLQQGILPRGGERGMLGRG